MTYEHRLRLLLELVEPPARGAAEAEVRSLLAAERARCLALVRRPPAVGDPFCCRVALDLAACAIAAGVSP